MLQDNAKSLRKNMTFFEEKLWIYLRDRRFNKKKFRRQVPLGKYIVDFICFDKKIIIELDGAGHIEKNQDMYDKARDNYFLEKGYKVLRIYNNDLNNNFEGVLKAIYDLVQ